MFPKTIFIMAALSGTCLARPMDHTEETLVISDSWNNSIHQPGKREAKHSAEPGTMLPRSFTTDLSRLWYEGVVPYEIDEVFNDWEVRKIGKAMKLFHVVSCVRWVPRTTEEDYVVFKRSRETCSSIMGKIGGRQEVNMKHECFYKDWYRGALVHEMMHALGFIHEQQRADRDCYLKISGKGKRLKNLRIIRNTDTYFPYDFHSLMQYKDRDYMQARNGERLGNLRGTLTEEDKAKLNYLYCGQPHYCTLYPEKCEETEKAEDICKITS